MSPGAKTVGLHLLGWVLFFFLIVAFLNHSPQAFSLPHLYESSFLLFFVVYAGLFYLNMYVLIPGLYLKQRQAAYFGLVLLLLAAIIVLMPYDRMLHSHMHPPGEERRAPFERMPSLGGKFPRRPGPGGRGIGVDLISIVLFLTVWTVGMAIQIFRQWRTTERRALQAEADKVNAELSFLKAQVNPHFLFNTLNNIYSLSITKSEQTPNAILKLSEILHYITDDVRNDFVPLQSEVTCVQNYIELQKLRLTDKVEVQFSVTGELDGKQIAPLLLMTFIENAFKYGISSHEPCVITIEIAARERAIDFFCRNKIMVRNVEDERVGVGIGNAEKRLSYLYPGKHLLNLHTDDQTFTVQLTIVN